MKLKKFWNFSLNFQIHPGWALQQFKKYFHLFCSQEHFECIFLLSLYLFLCSWCKEMIKVWSVLKLWGSTVGLSFTLVLIFLSWWFAGQSPFQVWLSCRCVYQWNAKQVHLLMWHILLVCHLYNVCILLRVFQWFWKLCPCAVSCHCWNGSWEFQRDKRRVHVECFGKLDCKCRLRRKEQCSITEEWTCLWFQLYLKVILRLICKLLALVLDCI